MQHIVTGIVGHMSHSHMKMARILEAKRHMAEHTASLVHSIPDQETTFAGAELITANAMEISKSVAAYLSSLAELEEAMAETLSEVMKELNEPSSEE